MNENGTLLLPPPESTIAGDVDALFYFILYLCTFCFIAITFLIVYFSVKYRQKSDRKLTTSFAHSVPLETTWTVIPAIIVVVLFAWGFNGFMKMQVVPRDAMEINHSWTRTNTDDCLGQRASVM